MFLWYLVSIVSYFFFFIYNSFYHNIAMFDRSWIFGFSLQSRNGMAFQISASGFKGFRNLSNFLKITQCCCAAFHVRSVSMIRKISTLITFYTLILFANSPAEGWLGNNIILLLMRHCWFLTMYGAKSRSSVNPSKFK